MYVSLLRLLVDASGQSPLLYLGLIVVLMASWGLIVAAIGDIVIKLFDVPAARPGQVTAATALAWDVDVDHVPQHGRRGGHGPLFLDHRADDAHIVGVVDDPHIPHAGARQRMVGIERHRTDRQAVVRTIPLCDGKGLDDLALLPGCLEILERDLPNALNRQVRSGSVGRRRTLLAMITSLLAASQPSTSRRRIRLGDACLLCARQRLCIVDLLFVHAVEDIVGGAVKDALDSRHTRAGEVAHADVDGGQAACHRAAVE